MTKRTSFDQQLRAMTDADLDKLRDQAKLLSDDEQELLSLELKRRHDARVRKNGNGETRNGIGKERNRSGWKRNGSGWNRKSNASSPDVPTKPVLKNWPVGLIRPHPPTN